MLRLACSDITEQGIEVCAPVHDAILIQAPLEEIEEATQKSQELMARASDKCWEDSPYGQKRKL